MVFERPVTAHLTRITRDASEVFPSIRQGNGVFAAGNSRFVAFGPGTYDLTSSNGTNKSVVVTDRHSEEPELGPWTLKVPAGWGGACFCSL